MKLHILGTCSGTEPMPGRKHTSVVLEDSNGELIFLDAGEGCSYTAHLMGLDLLRVRKILISHTHMDHVGGLANLLWTLRKLEWRTKCRPEGVTLYIPCVEVADAVFQLLRWTEGGFRINFPLDVIETEDGVLAEEKDRKITAVHNRHVKGNEQKEWLSFSYLVECEGKKIVYSGDLKTYSELDALIGEGCDALIVETAHFPIEAALEYLKEKRIGKIFLIHHKREIMEDPQSARALIRSALGDRAVLCEDATSFEIE